MQGKEKCKALKEIRKKIAEENDIEYVVQECTYQGECKGTCPKCEEELRQLEEALERRKKIGKAVLISGIALGAIGAATVVKDKVEDWVTEQIDDMSGTSGFVSEIDMSLND